MRSKIIYVVLFMLAFSAFHDSFISLIDTNEHTDIVHYVNDDVSSSECSDFSEIHSMFHFMAILSSAKNTQIHFDKREAIPHLLVQYTSPLTRTSYKPPIA